MSVPAGAPPEKPRARRGARLYPAILTVLVILLMFFFWRGTWFGRPLSEAEIERYLADDEMPRHIQHALAALSRRIEDGDARARRFFPLIIGLSGHARMEIRATAAWVMGEDNRHDPFRRALLAMLEDPVHLVRQNAALALSRFGEERSRPILAEMLRTLSIPIPADGVVKARLEVGEPVAQGTLLLRVEAGDGDDVETRSPIPGRVRAVLVAEGVRVAEGEEALILSPGPRHVFEALRAFYLVGEADDLPLVERYASGVEDMPDEVKSQAEITARAIRARGERGGE